MMRSPDCVMCSVADSESAITHSSFQVVEVDGRRWPAYLNARPGLRRAWLWLLVAFKEQCPMCKCLSLAPASPQPRHRRCLGCGYTFVWDDDGR
jgi:hypothetical protein